MLIGHQARAALAVSLLGWFATSATGAPAALTATDRIRANETDGADWAAYGRTFSEAHYSPLKQIDDRNVARLGLAWSYDLPVVSSVFSAPLAVDGVLYFAIGHSVVHAMDARTGKLLWVYDPEVYKVGGTKMRGGWGIRGIAYSDGRVFTGTLDGRLIALDGRTGALEWTAQTVERDDGRYITGAPWVFEGKVVIGHGGADFGGVRGYVTAYDAASGKQLWRFYTVPGDPKLGFEDDAMAMAAKTWHGEWWKYGGGGTAWHAMAYDPKYRRLYIGTGNGSPWNQKIRSPGGGDNLFLCSIIALDADTGKYVWHYQVNPGETWDYNAAMDIELAELEIGGKRRSVLLHAPKNGFFYVIDRADGKLVSAGQFAPQNWAERIDAATGRPVEKPDARFPDGKPVLVYPGPVGAHTVQAMSFNPVTGLVYIPTTDLGFIYSDPEGPLAGWQHKPGMVISNGIGKAPPTMQIPPGKNWLQAWDPVAQKSVWSIPMTGYLNGGTATTAGNLVFQGRADGTFNAYAADTGRTLWTFDAQAGVVAQPITYAAGGRQYVTVLAGWRGGGPNGSGKEWDYYTQKRRVLTFALDGQAKLPPPDPVVRPFVDDPAFAIDATKAESGRETFAAHCNICHGPNALSGGAAPDLRKAAVPLSLEALTAVVHGGALLPRGMPQFAEFSPAQIEGLQHYIRQRARESIAAQAAGSNEAKDAAGVIR